MIFKKCVLVRNVDEKVKELLYKYNEFGDILEQGKIECPIEDIKKAISFMETINYKISFEIYDKCIVYANDDTELVVQLVNDKYIFIEMEDKGNYIVKKQKWCLVKI